MRFLNAGGLLMLKEMTISAIVQYIEDNLELQPINIESLVLYSGYSRRYLQYDLQRLYWHPHR